MTPGNQDDDSLSEICKKKYKIITYSFDFSMWPD